MPTMRPIEHIRRKVFGLKQGPFAEIAGTTQPSISRWERGEQNPDAAEMMRIRDAALERGIEWDDRLFFEVPAAEQPAESAA